ncbi:MAG TPA: hypothetical protein VMB05_03290 [Solirubrobacteraceae bacterium]|nr:hypothetical protein [Solirubrobacteraceae bacterium]
MTTPTAAPAESPGRPAGDRAAGDRATLARAWNNARVPLFVFVVLLGFVCVIFHKQLFDHWSFPWDFLGTYTTTPAFVAATIGRGHAILWSPYVASGFPVDVDAQSGFYYPGWWVLGLFRISATLRVLTTFQIAHVLFAGLGVYALARARRLEWTWALLAGIAYVFFGGFYGQAEHADIFRGFAYLPWLLWALTPPADGGRWLRLAAVPLLAWLIATGAYPGQVVSFGLTAAVYLVVALYGDGRALWRRYRLALLLTVVAAAAATVAVLIPYLRAEQANELFRTIEPTAALRSEWALRPLDLLGLYLNNFSWSLDGTVTSWALAIPILIGLACTRLEGLRRHAPLVACGVLALLLAMTPKIGFIGHAMASIRPLFPSRFPASDYKATVALAIVVVSIDAWRGLSGARRTLAIRMAALGLALALGAIFAPDTHAMPTRALWLVIVVIVACVALAAARPPAKILVCALVVLVAIDGAREINAYRSQGVVSPWQVPPSALAFYVKRDGFVRELPERLAATPATRPARVPPASTAEPNASGWVADAYHESDYDSTIERTLWLAEHEPALNALLLAPWQAYLFPCEAVGCSGTVRLPAAKTWRASPSVHTLAYGNERIVYSVHLAKPMLMVENELAVKGWSTSSKRVKSIDAGVPFRAWRLSPGNYSFAASFQEPDRAVQDAVVVVALFAWAGCALLLFRRRSPARVQASSLTSP